MVEPKTRYPELRSRAALESAKVRRDPLKSCMSATHMPLVAIGASLMAPFKAAAEPRWPDQRVSTTFAGLIAQRTFR
jgi:hypothetical protein